MARTGTLQVAIFLFLLLLPAGIISSINVVPAGGTSALSASSLEAFSNVKTYGVGLSGAPVVLDEGTISSMGGGTIAQDENVIQEYFVPSGINFVFLDIGWGNDANTSTTQVAGGYAQWVNNWLYASNQVGIENVFFTRQWGYFFSATSWDQDVLNEYPSTGTDNASGVIVPLTNCAGCTSSSAWTDASPLIYRALEADLKQLYTWYGNYTNWVGFGEGATGDRNNYGSGTSGVIKTSRPFDNFTMQVYANSVFFQRLINPANGKYLSNGQVSKIWAMFVNDEQNVVESSGTPLVYPQDNQISGGGKSGNVLLQRFYVPFGESTSSFTVKSYAEKVGLPTGSLYLSIFADNSSTLNGRPMLQKVLANQTVSGVTTSLSWVSTSFTGVTLLGGDYYWAGYTSSSSGTSNSNYFDVICDQENVFTDIYTFVASNGLSHAGRVVGGSVLWLQSHGSTIIVYPYMNMGTNQMGGTAYFEVQSKVKANVVTFFVSDREYDPNNVTLSLECPNGTVLATAKFSIQLEYGVGTLSYLPLQLSSTVTLVPGIKYSLVASSLGGDNYVGSSGGGVTQDYITETANPASAGYLGQAVWPIFQLDYMILQPNGVSNYNYLGGTDLQDSPGGNIAGREDALRFKAASTETLTEFQVEVIGAGLSSASLQLSLRSDNTTIGSHPKALKDGAALATASVTLLSLKSAFHSGPTTTGEYALANFTSFTGSTSLTAGTYYWLVLNVTKNSYATLERLVEPEHLTYVSSNDFAYTWGAAGDGPSDLSFNIITSVQTIDNLVLGRTNYVLGNFAQSFKSPSGIQLTGLWVDAAVGGRPAVVSIRPDSGSDSPTSKVLSHGTLWQNTTGGSLNYAKLNLPVNITANTKYWIVIGPGQCLSSCSQATAVMLNVYSSIAHSSSVDYGGTTLHYETSSNGVTWTSPVSSAEGDMPFILATSVSTIKTYSTHTLYTELVADDAQASSYPPKGWNQFLDYEQAQINYNLTQTISALSGRTFQWFTGLNTNDITALPNLNSEFILTQSLGAGGPIGCPPTKVSCGGTEGYWSGDTQSKLISVLSSSNQSNVIGWSSFGATQDNAGDLTPNDLRQQYLVELSTFATSPLTANDWAWGAQYKGLSNFTQTAPMRSFGTLLGRMAFTGGYYGTTTGTLKVLWVYGSDDGYFPSYLEPVADVTTTTDSNLTAFGNLQQFNVIVDPRGVTTNAQKRVVAFVEAGGGIVEDNPPASWEYHIMGLVHQSSGCCTTPYTVLSGNYITKPYTSLPGYAPYYTGSFTKMPNESAIFEVTDADGYPVVNSNNYFSGRGVVVDMDKARLSYDSFGDSYMTLLTNAVLYAGHQDNLIPAVWTTTYATTQPWNQIVYAVDGSVGHPLLWVSSNSSSAQAFDVHLNATSFGITGSWVAVNMQNMSVIGSGSGSDIHIHAVVKSFDWLPVFILSVASNLNVMYSTLSLKSSSSNGQTGTYVVQGPHSASSWLVIKSTSSVTSVMSSITGTLSSQASLAALNQTKIGTFCTTIASSPKGQCNYFATFSQEGWYYDSTDQLLYIHFKGGSPVTLTVSSSGQMTTTTTSTTKSSSTTSISSSRPTSTTASFTTTSTSSFKLSSLTTTTGISSLGLISILVSAGPYAIGTPISLSGSTLSLAGSAAPSQTIYVWINGANHGSITSDSTGKWTVSFTPSSSGTYYASASQNADGSGITSQQLQLTVPTTSTTTTTTTGTSSTSSSTTTTTTTGTSSTSSSITTIQPTTVTQSTTQTQNTTQTTTVTQSVTHTSPSTKSETTTVVSSTFNQTTSAPPSSCEQTSSCYQNPFDSTIAIQSDAVSPVPIYVDGAAYATPSIFTWPVGSTHTLVLGEISVNTPTGQSEFVGWSGVNSTSTSLTITVGGDLSLLASYKNQYLVNVAFTDAEGRNLSPQNVSIRGPAGAFNLTDSSLWLYSGTYQVTQAEWMGTNVGSSKSAPVTFAVAGSKTIVVPLPIYDETIVVTDIYGLPISGANVTMKLGNQSQELLTGSTGLAEFRQVPLGYLNGTVKYLGFSGDVRISAPGEYTEYVTVTLSYPVLITILAISAVGTYFTVRSVRRRAVHDSGLYPWD